MKDITGYEGLYSIEEDGRVWSYISNRYLKQFISNKGYYKLRLFKDKIGVNKLIHRLLADVYIPNPDNKPLIDHINHIITDNRIENLRWATSSENNQNNSLHKNNRLKEKNIYYHIKYKDYRFRRMINGINHIKCFKTLEEAIAYRDDYSGFNP